MVEIRVLLAFAYGTGMVLLQNSVLEESFTNGKKDFYGSLKNEEGVHWGLGQRGVCNTQKSLSDPSHRHVKFPSRSCREIKLKGWEI